MILINEEYLPVFYDAIRFYGEQNQIVKALEEMSELTKELCRNNDRKAIVDETADVIIMLQQIMMIFRMGYELEERIGFKTNRLKERLDYTREKYHIKSADLCMRCRIRTNCVSGINACDNCDAALACGCCCERINYGTPCALFAEAEDENGGDKNVQPY